jgi:dUTP pyrophosphatase
MKVKIKKINSNAKLPVQSKPGDFCYDVWAVSEEELAPNVWMYGLGFKYEIERDQAYRTMFSFDPFGKHCVLDDYNVCISFRPRSSVWRTGMVLSNSEGVLDEFYRGEAKAVFYHVMTGMPRYRKGDKIGQIYVTVAPKVEFVEADEINEDTERGEGGFGSTGMQ